MNSSSTASGGAVATPGNAEAWQNLRPLPTIERTGPDAFRAAATLTASVPLHPLWLRHRGALPDDLLHRHGH
ncbi:hypothetical protein ACQPZP_25830 [Spirillospora sp. CA-142024]|uniref:hypothetical protein n=1 Tax=Spirillospora sp. CA-142024 TaxID=3240036 RepID=UPI003D8BF839